MSVSILTGSTPAQKTNKEQYLAIPLLISLSMGYEKDIFGSFAYDFELSQNNDISLARYDIRRCRMIYLLRKHDIISVPSYAKRISSA